MTKLKETLEIGNTNTTLGDVITKIGNIETNVVNLQSITNQFINKKYTGMTTSTKSFTIEGGIYLALLWINAGALVLPALYVVSMNSNGGGAVCCGESGNANLTVSGTTVTVKAPFGNAVFYCLSRISA